MLSKITGLPLDAQMQRNRLDVDEIVEVSGSAVAHVLLDLHVWLVRSKCSRCSTSKVSTRTEKEASHAGLLDPRVRRGESVDGGAAT
jgi:hypothetical protein